MWGWFLHNSVWVLIVVTLLVLVLLFFNEKTRALIDRAVPKKWHERTLGNITAIFWAIEGIAVAVMVLAFVGMLLSQEGAAAMVTVEDVKMWFLSHGTKILIILVVGMAMWMALKKFLPPLISRFMARPVQGESREGRKKRADTLQGVFMGLGRVIIILLVILMVLSELNVPIGPILAGFGIVGIAVGFGAQYLIRDLIAGIFILMENQYRVGDVARVADVAGLVEEINLRKTVLRD
ncbi:MAG: mechanosensitive ion channel domain-containing protein, partial [Chloroflexota bacterium]